MAEGLVNHFLGEAWDAYSAGMQPSGYVHPLAVQAMLELGINISGHRSKSPDELRDTHVDLVVTVCDDAAENCPVWLRGGQVVHIGFPPRPPEAISNSWTCSGKYGMRFASRCWSTWREN
jgi:arsenate reductase